MRWFKAKTPGSDYQIWRKRHRITALARNRMRRQIGEWKSPPLISLIVPSDPRLEQTLQSLKRQIYPNWQLLVVGPSLSSDVDIKAAGYASLQEAAQAATGQWIAVMQAAGELAEHALFKIAESCQVDTDLGMIYCDEDSVADAGEYIDPFFKPDWSPEYFLAFPYAGGLVAYRKDLVEKQIGWENEYDLALRIVAAGATVHHIPDILYHRARSVLSPSPGTPGERRGEGDFEHPNAFALPTSPLPIPPPEYQGRESAEADDESRAIENYLKLIQRPGTVQQFAIGSKTLHRVRYTIQNNPKVSIVIPSACREIDFKGRKTWFVIECVASIRKLSTYPNIEIIVLDNNDMSPQLAEAIKPFDVRLVSFTEPFNLARKMNLGGKSATGEQLILLNDDIEIISPDWIESMLEYSQWPEIGAVGVQLLFPDNTQQHTGVILLDGNPRHPFYHSPADHPGYFFSSQVHRNYSAVTGACMMTRTELFHQVGGFSENFPLNYNDVDYCLKLTQLGKRIVYMPHAKLYHHESVSKTGTHAHELQAFKKAWAKKVPLDPYYNPNLTRHFKVKVD